MCKSIVEGLEALKPKAIKAEPIPEPGEPLSLAEGLDRLIRGQHPFTAQDGEIDLSRFMRPERR